MQTHEATSDIRIHCVPVRSVAAVMRSPDVRALLARGMAAAHIDDALPTILQFMAGTKQLWLVFGADDPKPLAAWATSIHANDEGDGWLGVGELAGRDVRRWSGEMSDRMVEFARAEGCRRVVFFGRRGWKRLVRGYSEIGEANGVHLFERRVP